MANLYNTDLGGNSRKANPSSLFGTRDLVFISLVLYDYNLYNDTTTTGDPTSSGSYLDSDSLYCRIVTAIQEVAEVYYLGAPSRLEPKGFVFAISRETAEWFYSYSGDNPGQRYTAGTLTGALLQLFQQESGDPYGINDFDLREMEDCGFGLMPGPWIW